MDAFKCPENLMNIMVVIKSNHLIHYFKRDFKRVLISDVFNANNTLKLKRVTDGSYKILRGLHIYQ